MKLFTRYNRINLTVMVLLFVFSGICYYFLVNYVLVHELDEALDDYKIRIEKYVEKEGKLPPINTMDETRVAYQKTIQADNYADLSTVFIAERVEKRSHKYRQLTYIQKTKTENFRITIAKPIEGVKLLTRTVVGLTLAMLLLIIATSIFLNLIILKRLWTPFYSALAAMKTFKLGKNNIPDFPATDIEEFTYMNALLEKTISNAETDYQVLKEFTENASHEIQTPLAIIRSKLDLVIQEEGLSEKQIQALTSVYSGIKRLTKLNQSLLLLAKIENQQYAETGQVNLLENVQEKLSQFQEFWRNNEMLITSELHPATITANPQLIDILLTNLIGNAGRHNKEGGVIAIKLLPQEFYIENSGPEKPLDTDRLFRRFYKEQQHSQHNGLGLSIVKQICEQLSIDIQYRYNAGLHRFTLRWD
ncbi:sensor histidine kinase [Dyadobacter luticola]|uniref:histidine kinase n=1 Tax=Dyadobacter luticola TaxID=1979387 RepID=A0A5R9L257_9BACT|nr:HAMP domain-containing sensor histidine kinase [Dyadobacter luticola]TLV02501.1 HAMP domain-containing histidine kinase [Dyadobacter luticola]